MKNKNNKNKEKTKNSFGLSKREFMKDFIEIADKKGLDFAIDNAKKNPKLFDPINFTKRMENPFSRAYLSFILDTKKEKALDLGCGYGSLSLALSDIFKKVYSFDINDLCTKIVNIRSKEKNKKNIKTISGNAFDLNIKEKLDAAFMIGVLEWVPLSHNSNPKESQKEILRKMYNQLNEGGKMVVGIENRFGAQYFFGRIDHGGMKGTNLVPRKIANLIYKIKGRGEYRTYTHTYWEYIKMFEECGFSNVKVYLSLTSYIYPKFIIPLEKDKFRYAIENIFTPRSKLEYFLSKKVSKIVPFPLIKLFSPHFIIVGEKNEQKLNKEKIDFDKGIIRTGTSIVSTNPSENSVKKMIHKNYDLPDIKGINEINKLTDINIIVPSFREQIGNYERFDENFVSGKKLVPYSNNIKKITEKVFQFVCQLKNKNKNVFLTNFNYGNMILNKKNELNFIGLRNSVKADPILNLISFFESLYYYNEKFSTKESKEEVWYLFGYYLNKYKDKYKIKPSEIIKEYLRLYDFKLYNHKIIMVKSSEFKKRLKKIF